MASDNKYDAGMKVRRKVLGDDYVDQALNNATTFSAPFQKLVTEYCWGTIWTRDGIDNKMRSAINIAMLTAMNRPHELAAHVRGGLNNGLTPEEIQEILLQTAIYCGVPAALDSFRVAQKVVGDHQNAKATE